MVLFIGGDFPCDHILHYEDDVCSLRNNNHSTIFSTKGFADVSLRDLTRASPLKSNAHYCSMKTIGF